MNSYSITLSVFENNFLPATNDSNISEYFKNNNISYSSIDITTSNVGANNLFGQDAGSIFVKEDSDFEYGNDYHLQSGCPVKMPEKMAQTLVFTGALFRGKKVLSLLTRIIKELILAQQPTTMAI